MTDAVATTQPAPLPADIRPEIRALAAAELADGVPDRIEEGGTTEPEVLPLAVVPAPRSPWRKLPQGLVAAAVYLAFWWSVMRWNEVSALAARVVGP